MKNPIKLNILILEDNPERVVAFMQYFKLHNVTVCNNVEQAIATLKLRDWDFAFLDHDLEGKVYVDSANVNTGAEFIRHYNRHAKELNRHPVKTMIIHSHNYEGADVMFQLLHQSQHPDVRCEPFQMEWVKNFLTFEPTIIDMVS